MLVLAGQKEAVAADSIAFGASLLDRSCERKNCHIFDTRGVSFQSQECRGSLVQAPDRPEPSIIRDESMVPISLSG